LVVVTRHFVRFLLTLAACVAAPLAAAQQAGPNLNGYATLATAYWKRGFSQNNGTSAQLGIDFEHHTGFYVGAWAANIDFEREYSADEPRRFEADIYAGYHKRHEQWSWNVGLGHYLYPGTAINYDYNELSATFGFRDRLFYTAAYSDSYYGGPRSSLNQEVSLAYPLRGNVEIGGAVGKFRIDGGVLDVTYWNVGVSKLVRRLAIDLRYYDSNYQWLSYWGDPNRNHFVLSVSYALGGRRPKI
jgi:uncharacterized protein (TIGR02001 family)